MVGALMATNASQSICQLKVKGQGYLLECAFIGVQNGSLLLIQPTMVTHTNYHGYFVY